ncbi:MAG: hypothetical protein LBF51_07165 [Zoogloeaceae bacterium]|jgi:hypothetical protein|nr:hypothetical protein [Zoogloeaceae bacterium]
MCASPTAETFGNNPLLLAKCHVGVAVTYVALSVFGLVFFPEASIRAKTILAGLFVFGLIHAALAPACAKRNEQARRISEFLFSALILAFPIGTLLSIYLFLPATQWQSSATESDAEFEP